jgi:hypothetical protein
MGLFKNVQAMRDEANASEELQRIQQFKTPEEAQAYKTDSYLSAASSDKLEKLRAAKLDALLKEGAAAPLAKIQDLQMDPRFRDPVSVAEISRNPAEAVFGQRRATPSRTTGRMVDRGDGVMVNEVIPGEWEDGREAVTNPYAAQGIEKFQAGNLSKLDRFSAAGGHKGDDGTKWAGAGLGKEDANAFKDVAAAQKDYAGMDEKAAEGRAEQDLSQFIADNPAPRTVEEWNSLWDRARKIPNLPLKLVTDQQAAMQGRNDKRIVGYKEIKVGNGPNSTVKKVPINFLGEVIEGVSATASNNPSDRELGITGGGGGDSSGGMVAVSWVGPDGTPQSASIPRRELSTLKSSLKAQGVKELNTVDGKKASRTETLVKPEKGKRSILGDRPGGAPAAKATGGFTYVNGKLVPN